MTLGTQSDNMPAVSRRQPIYTTRSNRHENFVVTHKHGAGMTYAISGPHELTVDGIASSLNPGQAGWIGDQVVHSHASDGTTPTRFLFMYLRRYAITSRTSSRNLK